VQSQQNNQQQVSRLKKQLIKTKKLKKSVLNLCFIRILGVSKFIFGKQYSKFKPITLNSANHDEYSAEYGTNDHEFHTTI
jgi:hypothetical protein